MSESNDEPRPDPARAADSQGEPGGDVPGAPVDEVIAQLEALIAEDARRAAREDDANAAPVATKLWPVVEAALVELEWRYTTNGDGVAWCRVTGPAVTYDLGLAVDERSEVLRCWITMPVRVPERRRRAMHDLLAHLNAGQCVIGHLVLDDAAQPEWRYAVDVEGGLLGTSMVTNAIHGGLYCCDHAFAALMATAFARATPAAALALISD